jgi:hypothetical protein
MLIDIAIYALVIIALAAYKNDIEDELDRTYGTSQNLGVVTAIAVIIMIIIGLCLVLDLICIVKRIRHTLTPRYFLISNVIQTTIWTVLFILSMIGARTGATIGIGVFI